jgi:hypothetical protein
MTEKAELFGQGGSARRSTIILSAAQKRWIFDPELSAIVSVL